MALAERISRRAWIGPAIFVSCVACAHGSSRPGSEAPAADFVRYDYVALDGSRVSSEVNRGTVTMVAVIATYDLGSQVMMRELAEIWGRHRHTLKVVAVVLEPPKNAPLAEAFAATMELPFPIVMADQATLMDAGPFGRIASVPTLIVISPGGSEVWRHEGAVAVSAIERAIAAARRSG